MSRGPSRFLYRKIFGLSIMSMGIGMLLVILVPPWMYFFAALLVIFGFYLLFMY